MEIFCVFPFMVDFMMRSGSFDDAGHVHTFGLPPIVSNMVVSMQFDECNAEDEDGEEATICFNKKERFKCTDALFGYTLWEMVQNFGYAQKDDGTYEVYHYGQMWRGPFFIRLIFQMHARYVIFATEQHLNSERFVGKEETSDEASEGLRWFLDPLDGTVNFVHGIPMFSVSLALYRGAVPIFGVVHAPRLGETFVAAGRGRVAARGGRRARAPLGQRHDGPLRVHPGHGVPVSPRRARQFEPRELRPLLLRRPWAAAAGLGRA